MQPSIAGENLGFCLCGSHIEAGELIVMVQGRAVHLGCQKNAAQTERADPQMCLWRDKFLFDDTQLAALEYAEGVTGAEHISFDGPTILALDVPRLCGQVARVYELMR